MSKYDPREVIKLAIKADLEREEKRKEAKKLTEEQKEIGRKRRAVEKWREQKELDEKVNWL